MLSILLFKISQVIDLKSNGTRDIFSATPYIVVEVWGGSPINTTPIVHFGPEPEGKWNSRGKQINSQYISLWSMQMSDALYISAAQFLLLGQQAYSLWTPDVETLNCTVPPLLKGPADLRMSIEWGRGERAECNLPAERFQNGKREMKDQCDSSLCFSPGWPHSLFSLVRNE